MCVAELNVSVLPCRHRWYHLLRSCSPDQNLSNCSKRLVLEGWELKRDFCPWCPDPDAPDSALYRLIGNDRSPSSTGFGFLPPMSRCASVASFGQLSQGQSRRGSGDENSILTPSQQKHIARNREQNQKIEAIIRGLPASGSKDQDRPLTPNDEILTPWTVLSLTPLAPRSRSSTKSDLTKPAGDVTPSGGESPARGRRLGKMLHSALSKIGTFNVAI